MSFAVHALIQCRALSLRFVWRPAICFVVGITVTSPLGGCASHRQHAFQRRHAAYDATLRSYSEDLKPGTTRELVEQYLRQRRKSFEPATALLSNKRLDGFV